MIPLEEVRAVVMSLVRVTGSETVDLAHALGRVLGEDAVSVEPVPPFPNSAMDGFAVRSTDVTTRGSRLRVVADLPAGVAPEVPVGPGEAVRIMTGAPLPEGADTVVRVEDTSVEGEMVRVTPAVPPGTSVRPAGGDVAAGEVVLPAGTRLGPAHLGLLAAIGCARPVVRRRPRVALMSTGDELMPPSATSLGPGRIRDANRPMLAALLAEAGCAVTDLGIVPDRARRLSEALDRSGQLDAIVSSGGVSMGEHDVTKILLQERGGVEFVQVAIQPAKPFAYGKVGAALFFGLPGNPVSALVSFEQLVRPALLAMAGAVLTLRPRSMAVAGEDLDTDPEKTVFLRVRLEDGESGPPRATLSGAQGSNILSAAAGADAFAVVPRGVKTVERGEPVSIELFRAAESRRYRDGI